MSSYEDYGRASKNYDKTRQPVGAEVMVGCMAMGGTPLPEMTLLDAGCGTGNYSVAMIPHVGRIEAVDMNPAMIEVAAEKLSGSNVSFHEAPIDELPFEDSSFNGVMVNQVLHHLPENGDGFSAHRRVVEEFHRVLKPGGVLTINTCSQTQLEHGYWYYSLIPEAVNSLRSRYAPLDKLVELMESSGLEYGGRIAPTDAVVQGDAYFDHRGPLDEEWRDGDSIWSLASEEERSRALSKVEAMDERGELEEYVAAHDTRRMDIGQVSILHAVKSLRGSLRSG
ncbi:MAG: class I SAM-dependent methyltransferase [Actinomycetota bacterium]|nr:class I SAM-dependent methyltransferase [Actinomycetota bacterium]